MLDKIKAKIEELAKEKDRIINANEDDYVKECLAEYEAKLREELSAKKAEAISAIDFKLEVLHEWEKDELAAVEAVNQVPADAEVVESVENVEEFVEG